MTIEEVYKKYKHLDKLLSDDKLWKGAVESVLVDLWMAIKDYMKLKEAKR